MCVSFGFCFSYHASSPLSPSLNQIIRIHLPPEQYYVPYPAYLIFIVAPSCTSLNVCRCTLCHEGVQYNTSLSLRGTYAKSKSPSIEYPREDIPYHGQRTTYRATHHQPPTSPTEQLMVGASPATQQLGNFYATKKMWKQATRDIK